MKEVANITLGVGAVGEGQHEFALGVNDTRCAFDESVAQRANTLERPKTRASSGVVRSPGNGTHLKLAPESVRDEITEHVDLVADLVTRR